MAILLVLGGLSMTVIPATIPLVLGARSLQLRITPGPAAPSPTATAAPLTISSSVADAEAAELEPDVLLDERFDNNQRGWPDDAGGGAWLDGGAYHLRVRFADRFVAVRAPIIELAQDVVVSATFHKHSGPQGGGYGLILRDRSRFALDGQRQDGEYYVFEAGDTGLVGVWRRNGRVWVDLVPWSPSAAVRTGKSPNLLTVRVSGIQFTFEVNGVEVARVTDAVLDTGHVGLFVGGDDNEVIADRFMVQRLSTR